MTLFKQIIIVLSIFQTIIFGAVMWFNFNSANEYVQEQAYTDALHTANSLGLSISSVVSEEDVSMSEAMINAVFDSGYYEKIYLQSIDGEILVSKEQKVVVADVPAWFIRSIKIVPPMASSQIMMGWSAYGVLYVQVHSGHAYRQLWTIFKEVLSVFGVVSIIGILILQLLLRVILRPLQKVKEQAEAILENDFIFQRDIPFTQELKNVVFAMNSMVKKVKEIFDKEADVVQKYNALLYQDPLSKMYNRRYFNLKLDEYLCSEVTHAQGALILFSLNDFESLKQALGYQQSELFIKALAEYIREAIAQKNEYVSAKLNDTDFALLAPYVSGVSYDALCEEIHGSVKRLIETFGLDTKVHFITTGYALYYASSSAKELFSKADFALSTSKAKGAFSLCRFVEEGNEHLLLGKEAWAKEFKDAWTQRRFKLAYQDAVVLNDVNTIYHREFYVRLQDVHGKMHHAGYFMPMLMELKLGAQLDQHVIECAIDALASKHVTCKDICINLGKDIFMQSHEWSWLEDSTMRFKALGEQVVYFEVPSSAGIPTDILVKFSKYLRGLGYGLGLDNFFINSENLVAIQHINPSYIKIQASYLLDTVGENQIDGLNRSLGIITDSMDIHVIACNVESQAQCEKLANLNIRYIQGSFIGEPKIVGEMNE